MNENSRVVHCRLKDDTILGCRDLLLGSDHKVDGMPMSSIVRVALEGIIDFMIRKGQLPSYPDATTALNMVYVAENPTDPEFGLEGLMESMKGGISEDTLISQLAEEATRQIEEASIPNIAEDVNIADDVEPTPKTKIDIFELNRDSLIALTIIAPKDRLIQLANESGANKIFIAALEATYTNLPVSMWGSEIAEIQIKNLQDNHIGK